jgi:ATP-dependent Clp protease protease subunit
MAAVILSAGERGHRCALPHSQIMLHAPSGGTGRVTSPDFKIAAKEMEKCEEMLYSVLSENLEKDYDAIKQMCDRDFWMTSKEAMEHGVIDTIL